MDSLGAELERLAHLHASGHLSDDEYEVLKERLLESTVSTAQSETVAGDSVDWVKEKAAEATAWIEEKLNDPDLLTKGGELAGKGQKIGKRGRFTGAGQLLLGASNVASNLIERRKHELLAGVSEEAATSVAKPQRIWVPDAVSGESGDEADAGSLGVGGDGLHGVGGEIWSTNEVDSPEVSDLFALNLRDPESPREWELLHALALAYPAVCLEGSVAVLVGQPAVSLENFHIEALIVEAGVRSDSKFSDVVRGLAVERSAETTELVLAYLYFLGHENRNRSDHTNWAFWMWKADQLAEEEDFGVDQIEASRVQAGRLFFQAVAARLAIGEQTVSGDGNVVLGPWSFNPSDHPLSLFGPGVDLRSPQTQDEDLLLDLLAAVFVGVRRGRSGVIWLSSPEIPGHGEPFEYGFVLARANRMGLDWSSEKYQAVEHLVKQHSRSTLLLAVARLMQYSVSEAAVSDDSGVRVTETSGTAWNAEGPSGHLVRHERLDAEEIDWCERQAQELTECSKEIMGQVIRKNKKQRRMQIAAKVLDLVNEGFDKAARTPPSGYHAHSVGTDSLGRPNPEADPAYGGSSSTTAYKPASSSSDHASRTEQPSYGREGRDSANPICSIQGCNQPGAASTAGGWLCGGHTLVILDP